MACDLRHLNAHVMSLFLIRYFNNVPRDVKASATLEIHLPQVPHIWVNWIRSAFVQIMACRLYVTLLLINLTTILKYFSYLRHSLMASSSLYSVRHCAMWSPILSKQRFVWSSCSRSVSSGGGLSMMRSAFLTGRIFSLHWKNGKKFHYHLTL